MKKLYLASASPRRILFMGKIAPGFTVYPALSEEKEYHGLSPAYIAANRAKDKCLWVADRVEDGRAVLSADTVVDLGGCVLDKPKDKKDAFRMMCALSGKSHWVHTGVCLRYRGMTYSFCRHTKVVFRHIPLDVIKNYINTPEPYDKAGGYGIQGSMGRYIRTIKGDYYNVVGLPVKKVKNLLSVVKIV